MTTADTMKFLIVGGVLIGTLFTLKPNKNSFTKLPYIASTVVLMSFFAFFLLRILT